MKTEGIERQEHILEAAIRRFSHFGIHKTTLTEVADDLSISKQALHYYFADKQSLIAAVQDKITTDYLNGIAKTLEAAGSTENALVKLIDVKKDFFEKYFMLASQFRGTDSNCINADKKIEEVKQKLIEEEKGLLAALFQKGIASGELKTLDTVKTAGLLLDTITAFTYCISAKSLPEPKDFKDLYRKQKEVMQLFYNGLKS